MSLYDVIGRGVLRLPRVRAGETATADVSALPGGTYVLRAVSEAGVGTRVVVVE